VSVRAPRVQRPEQQAAHPHNTDYRGDIDGLRAVAVTLVVLFHVGSSVLPGGFVGVDVFYVISGFLITGLLVRELRSSGTVSIANFYARRVRRLLPLSALVLVTTAIASRFLAPVLDRPGIGSDIQAAATYVANWHFATASTQYMASTGKSPVLHYWSLSVEEQFYVLWPLLLLLASSGAARRSWQVGVRRIAVTLGVLGTVSFTLSVVTTTTSGPFAFFGLHTRAWELAVGAGLALATDRWLRRPTLWSISLGWIGLLMVLGSAGLLTGDTPYPGSAAALPVLGTAMLLASGAARSSWSVGRLLSLPPVRYLGRISYAWYLWHWPCLVLLGGVGADSAEGAGDQSAGGPGVTRLVAAIAASLVLSVLSHHLVENPARRTAWLSRFTGRSLMLGVLRAPSHLRCHREDQLGRPVRRGGHAGSHGRRRRSTRLLPEPVHDEHAARLSVRRPRWRPDRRSPRRLQRWSLVLGIPRPRARPWMEVLLLGEVGLPHGGRADVVGADPLRLRHLHPVASRRER
jgi:peptidoglycan/LPS O-acetylase OafA/YrhL